MVKSDENIELPGREIPKEYREVATELVRNQGWRYVTGAGYPKLYPPDGGRQIAIPKTPGDKRSFRNWLALVRRSGGIWPPEGRR